MTMQPTTIWLAEGRVIDSISGPRDPEDHDRTYEDDVYAVTPPFTAPADGIYVVIHNKMSMTALVQTPDEATA